MSGLTREKIKVWRMMANQPGTDYGKLLDVRHHIGELCDLALQSLSQEAVRDEALEEAAEAVNHLALYGPPEYSLAFCQAVEAIRVLKREPNAAAWDRSTERASGERTSAGTSPSPAPAAPDVAEMVKRLEELQSAWLPGIGECFPITFTPAERTTLLARLGQGWIPSETVIEIDEDGKVHPEGANLKNLRPGASDD